MIYEKGQEPTNIIENFEDWTLDDPNPGRQEFFAEVMSALENNESGYASFSVGVPMDRGVGGYFTNTLALDQINLPRIATADFATQTIKFHDEEVDEEFMKENPDYEPITADRAFAFFVHEACHFLHFSRDGGEFTSPLMKGKVYTMNELIHSPKVRREAEFEAGYRSVKYNAMLRLYPEGDRTILETNLHNMMNYDKPNQSREWFDKYRKIVEPWLKDAKDENGDYIIDNKGEIVKSGEIAEEHKKDYENFFDSLFAKVEKFTEWADPKHEIKGVMDYELPEVVKPDQDVEKEKAIKLLRSMGYNVSLPGEDTVDTIGGTIGKDIGGIKNLITGGKQ